MRTVVGLEMASRGRCYASVCSSYFEALTTGCDNRVAILVAGDRSSTQTSEVGRYRTRRASGSGGSGAGKEMKKGGTRAGTGTYSCHTGQSDWADLRPAYASYNHSSCESPSSSAHVPQPLFVIFAQRALIEFPRPSHSLCRAWSDNSAGYNNHTQARG